LEWKKKMQSIASIHITIQDELENLPESYTPLDRKEKELVVFQHVYDHYSGDRKNVYLTNKAK